MVPVDLDFERPIVELERKAAELRGLAGGTSDLASEIQRLESKAQALREKVFAGLTAWQRVELARHPQRPRPIELAESLIEELVELCGDRSSGDDPGVFTGVGYCDRRAVAVVALGRGRPVPGGGGRWSAWPTASGVDKTCRLLDLADRFELPLVTLVDMTATPPEPDDDPTLRDARLGRAVAELLALLVTFPHPVVAVVTGEAYGELGVAFTTADRLLMLEYAVFGAATPESVAAAELGDIGQRDKAAGWLHLTAPEVGDLGVCDEVVAEPAGGAHRQPAAAGEAILAALRRCFAELQDVPAAKRHGARRDRLARLTPQRIYMERTQSKKRKKKTSK